MFSSCQKGFLANWGGQEIRFSASFGPGTKTAYSGDIVTEEGVNKELINWVEGDQVMIWSDNAVTRYDDAGNEPGADHNFTYVANPVEGGKKANLVHPVDKPNGLIYVDGANEYQFWAACPAEAVKAFSDANVSYEIGNQSGSGDTDVIPADMSKAMLLGYAKSGPEEDINLAFKPAFSAFEIHLTVSESSYPIRLSSLQFSDIFRGVQRSLLGGVTAAFEGKEFSCRFVPTAGTSFLKYTFDSAKMLNPGDNLTFTVIVPPVDINDLHLQVFYSSAKDDYQLKVEQVATFKDDGGNPIVFPAFGKHRLYGLVMEDGSFKFRATTAAGSYSEEWAPILTPQD